MCASHSYTRAFLILFLDRYPSSASDLTTPAACCLVQRFAWTHTYKYCISVTTLVVVDRLVNTDGALSHLNPPDLAPRLIANPSLGQMFHIVWKGRLQTPSLQPQIASSFLLVRLGLFEEGAHCTRTRV
jgi:hypothetical protein